MILTRFLEVRVDVYSSSEESGSSPGAADRGSSSRRLTIGIGSSFGCFAWDIFELTSLRTSPIILGNPLLT